MKKDNRNLAHLSPREKRQLLAELLQEKARRRTANNAGPTNTSGPPNTSGPAPAQERLGAFDQFAVSSGELEAEVALDPAIRPPQVPGSVETEPAHIFLTGATGFLGAFLLYELLQTTDADVTCLVRAPSAETGRQRIEAKLGAYLPGRTYDRSRIRAVAGDLAQPLLGLSPEAFERLAARVDVVYHSAAQVNWIDAYEKLKPSNVLGTQEILRLTSHTRLKPLHYVSTLAVFPLVRNSGAPVVREQDTLDHGGLLYGGYTQSKWVAEKLVGVARCRGLPVTVYRPGLITGHSETGAWNTADFTCQLLKSWITTGVVPDMEAAMDMTPVDYVSRALVHLSLGGQARQLHDGIFHLANPQAVDLQQLYGWMRSLGYRLQALPYEEWRAGLLQLSQLAPRDGLRSLIPLLSAQETAGAGQWVGSVPQFDCTNTLEALVEPGIRCPAVDEQTVSAYFAYLVRSGFLHAPQAYAGRAQETT